MISRSAHRERRPVRKRVTCLSLNTRSRTRRASANWRGTSREVRRSLSSRRHRLSAAACLRRSLSLSLHATQGPPKGPAAGARRRGGGVGAPHSPEELHYLVGRLLEDLLECWGETPEPASGADVCGTVGEQMLDAVRLSAGGAAVVSRQLQPQQCVAGQRRGAGAQLSDSDRLPARQFVVSWGGGRELPGRGFRLTAQSRDRVLSRDF